MMSTQDEDWGEQWDGAGYETWEVDQDADDEELDTIPCPACSREVYEEAEQCPNCGEYLLDAQVTSQAPWLVWTAIVLIVVLLLGTLGPMLFLG